ncbi:unnamed protein product [Rhizophagus irregularis]|nr:unnamed protein product [Rhizophagus irregularis]CAB5362197.1 unnamed protein product [Rhizophagus irregularis]
MPRSDKKDTTCVCCGYKFTRPAKLRQSKKNQCSPPPEISSQKEGRKKANIPRPRSPSPAPLAPPSEQNQGDKYIDRYARKTGEHLRTWGSRLHLRWFADDEARENDQEDPKAGPSPSTQTHREGLAPIPQDEDQDIEVGMLEHAY